MKKPKMPRLIEPGEGVVHYTAAPYSGNETLCGITDFIYNDSVAKATRKPVDCESCISVKAHCDAYEA